MVKGSVAVRNFLAPRYYGQRAVFASLWALFPFFIVLCTQSAVVLAILSVCLINAGTMSKRMDMTRFDVLGGTSF